MSLPADFDFASYTEQVVSYTSANLSVARSEGSLAGRIHLLTTAAERDLVRFGDQQAFERVACAPGCSSCCVVNIAVLVPEAITIARYLRRHLDEDSLAAVKARLKELYRKTRWLDDEERLFLRMSCAFLDPDGKCLIHKVRPLLCRSITSLDGTLCQEAIALMPLGEAPVVVMNLFQKEFFEAVYQGLARGVGELGWDDRPWQLSAALHSLLNDTGIVERYLLGESVVCH